MSEPTYIPRGVLMRRMIDVQSNLANASVTMNRPKPTPAPHTEAPATGPGISKS